MESETASIFYIWQRITVSHPSDFYQGNRNRVMDTCEHCLFVSWDTPACFPRGSSACHAVSTMYSQKVSFWGKWCAPSILEELTGSVRD